MLDIRPLVAQVLMTIARHNLGAPGAFRRWLAPGEVNEYGCADAANILYTIGHFPTDVEERKGWVAILQGMQQPETGLFSEATHHPIHTTAHCIAALELFDAKPRYPVTALFPYVERTALETFLHTLDWLHKPWPESHKGAGLYVSLVLTDAVTQDWQDWYYAWLWNEADPETGFWRKGYSGALDAAPLFHHLASSFHYVFNHEYARRPLRYPERMIDSCLHIYREGLHAPLGRMVDFAEIDWVYCLHRASRQTAYRFAEVKETLRDFAASYVAYLSAIDHATEERWNDLHMLFGATCALAELQQALPGQIVSEKPLKLVLDRRPFI